MGTSIKVELNHFHTKLFPYLYQVHSPLLEKVPIPTPSQLSLRAVGCSYKNPNISTAIFITRLSNYSKK